MTSTTKFLANAVNASLRRADLQLRRVRRWRGVSQRGGDPEIVARAKRHLASANQIKSELPHISTQWRPFVDKMRAEISQLANDPTEVLHFAQRKIPFDIRGTDTGGVPMTHYDFLLKNEMPQLSEMLDQVTENPHSIPESLFDLHGRPVSNVMFWQARILLSCFHYLGTMHHIIEVGGTYGALAGLWMRHPVRPASSYAIVDIPETLFFAECALRQEFGDAVGYFDGVDPGTPIVLVPLCHLSSFARAGDLVINNASMHLFTDEWIDYYMQWLDRIEFRYFYSLHRYAESPVEDQTFWGPRPSSEWSTRLLKCDIPLLKLQSGRDICEAIYEKKPAQGALRDWNAWREMFLSGPVYLEGLDLLRQSLTVADATAFVQKVFEGMPHIPKEVFWISRWLENAGHRLDAGIRPDQLGGRKPESSAADSPRAFAARHNPSPAVPLVRCSPGHFV
jgi:hypothetical protein